MGRKIRLTESQFRRMVARIVKESKHQYDEEIIEDEDFGDDEMSEKEAVQKLAEYIKSEVLPELSPREISKIKNKVQQAKGEMTESLYEEEESDDLPSRRSKRGEKLLMRGGLSMAATGAVLSLGEFMGYSEFELTRMLHELNSMAGLDEYTGPLTVGMVFAGLALALKGLDMKMRREER